MSGTSIMLMDEEGRILARLPVTARGAALRTGRVHSFALVSQDHVLTRGRVGDYWARAPIHLDSLNLDAGGEVIINSLMLTTKEPTESE